MRTTKIEWTDKTWNPITGCTKKSAGCAHCYAEVMARRLKAMGLEKYQNGFGLTLHEDDLEEPLQWKRPHNIFVCSMSDIFHEDVPFEFIDKINLYPNDPDRFNKFRVLVDKELYPHQKELTSNPLLRTQRPLFMPSLNTTSV